MNPIAIFLPTAAMALLTLVVWLWMYATRFYEMYRAQISAQDLATRDQARRLLAGVTAPADNLMNLFEMPVLFYAGVIIVYVVQRVDPTFLALAWSFVGLRVIHSAVHCTYNRVTHRFVAYALSSIALWGFWGRLGLALLEAAR